MRPAKRVDRAGTYSTGAETMRGILGMGDPFRSGTVGAVWVEGGGLCSEGFGDALTPYLGTNARLSCRDGSREADHLASETEALLSFFLGLLRGVCLDNLLQAGAGSHRELQL